jgi:serine/threonine-protein kinase
MDELLVELEKLREGHVPDAVGEMMARSGGFNVPADYFQKAQMPALVPATPASLSDPSRSRWPLVAGLIGSLAAVAVVLAIFAKSGDSNATTSASVANATPEAPRLAEAPAAPAQPVERPDVKQVMLAAEPLDAHVFRGDADLGASPVVVEVPAGQVVEVEIRRHGFKPETVALDGSSARKVVKLDRVATAGARAVARPPKPPEKAAEKPPKKRTGGGTGEIVDPWN